MALVTIRSLQGPSRTDCPPNWTEVNWALSYIRSWVRRSLRSAGRQLRIARLGLWVQEGSRPSTTIYKSLWWMETVNERPKCRGGRVLQIAVAPCLGAS